MVIKAGPNNVSSNIALHIDPSNINSYNPSENLLQYTNSIGGTGYSNTVSGISTLNSTMAPDGTYTATKIDNQSNAGTTYVFSSASINLNPSTEYTYSIFVKKIDSNIIYMTIDEASFGGKRYQVYFNASNETVATSYSGVTSRDGLILGSGVKKYENGWYRIYISFKTSSSNVSGFVDMISRFSQSNVGANYYWGRQLEYGSQMTNYTPVESTAYVLRSTTIKDLSTNLNNGTIINAPSYSIEGNGSFYFDGTAKYISIADNASLKFSQSESMSLSAWFKPTALWNTWTGIVTKSRDSSPWYGIWLNVSNQIVWGSPYSNMVSIAATTNWQNVVLTKNNTDLYIYVNGVLQAQNATPAILTNGTGALYIGGAASVTEYFNGYIGDVTIYNKALSAAEVLQNFNALQGRYGI